MQQESSVRKLRWALALALLVGIASFVARRRSAIHAEPLVVDDPQTLVQLERTRLSFDRVVGRDRLEQIARVVTADMAELTAGQSKDSPRRPFKPEWLTRGRFELVGVINRFDRRRFDASTCGELRLVYRLALENPGRPVTRLPFTLNVRIPQPRPKDADCTKVAKRWLSRPDLVDLVDELPPPAQIEIDFQSIHTPAYRPDMDDSAEYVLRSFEVSGRVVREGGLFGTPRPDVDAKALRAWIAGHLREIDEGAAVLPDELLARRAISVSPRGLARPENRPFSRVLSTADLAGLPLDGLAIARTPELLLRRVDEMTCPGCHQTRGVAGFHLLGEERSTGTFNTLAIGHSGHFGADLAWRKSDLERASRGLPPEARPFAAHPTGELGSTCGLVPGLSAWSCRPGLTCRDVHHADVGTCVERGATAPGVPCEDVELASSARPEGPVVRVATTDATCPAPTNAQRAGGRFCAPNWLGFTGGACTEYCDSVGEARGTSVCAPVPAAGYEADCFVSDEPIEACLARHLIQARLASCDAEHPCRDDYGCARVPGANTSQGSCVPPYFIFQARVDGPRLDR